MNHAVFVKLTLHCAHPVRLEDMTMSACDEKAGKPVVDGAVSAEPTGRSDLYRPVSDLVGVGRIGAALARALARHTSSRAVAQLNGDRDAGTLSDATLRRAQPGPDLGSQPDLVFLLIASGEPRALQLGENVGAARRAIGLRTVAIVMHGAAADRETVQSATAGLAAVVDAIVVTPEFPHLSVLDSLLQIYRTATGGDPARGRKVAMPAGSEFLDVRGVFKAGRRGVVGVGFAAGPERIFQATSDAIEAVSETSLSTASGMLVIVGGAETLRLGEVASALYQVHARTRGDAEAVLASHYDERMGGLVRVTVVAAI
ncbi:MULTISPECIES: cell division protein FtsZ [unclassified Burkholderia]|uniref:cell division protein FtsZ n=1 Tax=unclassified Burkholderia TaxID=2613784 RepID=UPI001F03958B|nr:MULTISPECIES: cell division protein FtsZ [unclassified Burkholderia]